MRHNLKVAKNPPKLKNDIKIIRVVDGKEISCSYNSCRDKFEEDFHLITRNPKWNKNQSITSKTFFWKCKDCGAKVNGKGHRTKSFDSYYNAILGHDESV